MTEFITAFISVMATAGVFATVLVMSDVAIWLYKKWRIYLCRPGRSVAVKAANIMITKVDSVSFGISIQQNGSSVGLQIAGNK